MAVKSGAGFPTVGAAFTAEGALAETGRQKRRGAARFPKATLGERRVESKAEVEAMVTKESSEKLRNGKVAKRRRGLASLFPHPRSSHPIQPL